MGGLVGAVVVARLASVFRPAALFPLSLGATGLTALAMCQVPLLLLGLAALFLIGISATGASTNSQTLLRRSVPDAYLGRISGTLGATVDMATLGGEALASELAERLGILVMLNASGGLYDLAGMLALAMIVSAPALLRTGE